MALWGIFLVAWIAITAALTLLAVMVLVMDIERERKQQNRRRFVRVKYFKRGKTDCLGSLLS